MADVQFVVAEAVNAAALSRAIERGTSVLLQTQRRETTSSDQRYWDAPGDLGPANTAQVLVALAHSNEITDDERREGSRWLRAHQHADGGYSNYPNARQSSVGATASAWAAMHMIAPMECREQIAKARAFIDRSGGLPAVVKALETGDVGAVFLSIAGLLDPQLLPSPIVAWALVPPVVDWLETRVSAVVPFLALQMSMIVRRLRGDFGPNGDDRGLLARLETAKCISLMDAYQNADGSWNANTMQTAMALPALWGAGVPANDPRRKRAVAWLRTQVQRDHDGIWFQAFGSAVWSTALNVVALVASGVPASDERIADSLRWIAGSQCTRPQPQASNRKAGAVRTGGWAFQRGNDTMVDCDDTGIVLTALGQMLAQRGEGALPPALATTLEASVRRGAMWIENMQNPDGGWAAFVWGLPGKPAGPIMEKSLSIDFHDPIAMLNVVLEPVLGLGDPATEDLTGRVLCGLGAIGRKPTDATVRKALQFLRSMQCDDGSFWGRWTMNYVAGTSWVLLGAMAVGADPDEAWLKLAISWLESKQNADGGWGETTASYRDRNLAGKGPSMPPLTGLVVQALIAANRTAKPSVTRGVNYLVRSQRPDGTWPANGYIAPNVPPDTFYSYPETERHNTLTALARYRAAQSGPKPPPPSGRWNDAQMDQARTQTDPLAEEVVEQILQSGQVARVDELFATMLRSDDPIPAGLPALAKQYFADTEPLPPWTDHGKLAIAEKLFERAGWQIAVGLFSSSLPQSYAAANGATALAKTTGMRAEHVDQRIFETAQFLFDVCDAGAFDLARGRGIRAAQKVRLMHAGVRRLIIDGGGFDTAKYGQPINQEDLAGTLMTFSVVTLDALNTFGIPVSSDEAEAWLHAWKIVGHYLGLRPEYVPTDVEDGRALMDAIRRRQWGHSDKGRALTQTLMGLMATFGPPGLGTMPAALIRFVAGDYCGDLLDVPRPNWMRFVVEAGAAVGKVIDPFAGHSAGEALFQQIAFEMMRLVVQSKRGFKNATFRIPASLQGTVIPGT